MNNSLPTINHTKRGTIQYYNARKGYGVIVGDDGSETLIFQCDIDFSTLLEIGDYVEFEIEESILGKKAVQVKILKSVLLK
jgi:cold shock CspA family protein